MARPKRLFTAREKKLIVALYGVGRTDQQVADTVEMPRKTFLYALKSNHLVATIKKAKHTPDLKVENALYKRAIGYEYVEKKAEKVGLTLVRKSATTKEVAPDVTACIFWLCNRNPDRWKNVQKQIAPEVKGITFMQLISIVNGQNTKHQPEIKAGSRIGRELF